MNKRRFWPILIVLVLVSILGTQCSPATPAPATKAPAAPAPAVTQAPAATAPAAVATTAPAAAATAAPAAATKAPATAVAPTTAPAAAGAAGTGVAPAVKSGKYGEAPAVRKLVDEGKLPSVDKRLPDEPLVVPVTEKVGMYGGIWRRGFLGPSDANNYVRVVYDALVRYSPDGGKIEPKLIKSWESSADFKVWTLNMRKGAKWSDGTAFTADDIVFWYKDCLLNKDLTPSTPNWMKNQDGSVATVEKVDDYTVRFTYKGANNLFLQELANKDGGDRTLAVFLPSAYLKKFHANYAAKADLDKLVADAKLKTWTELFMTKAIAPENPERPTMAAWTPATRVSDQIFSLKRNPYYVGVDPEGNQLPYIDEVQFVFFSDVKALNLAAIAGDFHEIERHIDMPNYPVLKEQEQKGAKYRVLTWPSFGGADANIIFNQTYTADETLGEVLRTKDFRVALSYAINRNQIKESAFLGLGEARQPIPAPGNPYYPGDQYAKMYTEFKPDEANKLLDGIGLNKKDAEGYRLMKNGKRLTVEMSVVPAFGPWTDIAQLIAKDWEKVGVRTIVQVRERALHFKMRETNELQTELWNTNSFPFTGNPLVDPRATTATSLGPLFKTWFSTGGKEGMEPPADLKRIVEIIDTAKLKSTEEQNKMAQELYKLWAENAWQVGTVGLTAMIQGVVVVSKDMINVPATLGNDWPLRTPGNARTEQFAFTK